MTAHTPPTIRVSRRFAASAERVFDAWLDPEKAGRFLYATPTGQMIKAEIDARVGGAYCFTDRRDGVDVEHVGTYLEIDRPRRLCFTLQVPTYSQDVARITITIVPLDRGCELTLDTDGVPAEWGRQTEEGWTAILGTLSTVVD